MLITLTHFILNRENMAKGGGICVANHTSPIDVLILACDNCYSMVRQQKELQSTLIIVDNLYNSWLVSITNQSSLVSKTLVVYLVLRRFMSRHLFPGRTTSTWIIWLHTKGVSKVTRPYLVRKVWDERQIDSYKKVMIMIQFTGLAKYS